MKEIDRIRQDVEFMRLGNATRKTCKTPGCRRKAISHGHCKKCKAEALFGGLGDGDARFG